MTLFELLFLVNVDVVRAINTVRLVFHFHSNFRSKHKVTKGECPALIVTQCVLYRHCTKPVSLVTTGLRERALRYELVCVACGRSLARCAVGGIKGAARPGRLSRLPNQPGPSHRVGLTELCLHNRSLSRTLHLYFEST